MTVRQQHWYGYNPDHADIRDHKFKLERPDSSLPASVDLRQYILNIKDQGEEGSCTAHAITSAIEFDRAKKNLPNILLARNQLYYDERAYEGTTDSDSGAMPRDGIKSATIFGVAKEELWPYYTAKFADKPTIDVYTDALNNKVLTYKRIDLGSLNAVKTALATGLPVVTGISVYDSFESEAVAKTGIVNIPDKSENQLGGHCVLIVGYGQKDGYFTVLNSWGKDWGDAGYFYLPYDYVTNQDLTSDLWVIDSITSIT